MKHPPLPPPPRPPPPPNVQEIADQQLRKTAPATPFEQNKENVQILKDFNKNIHGRAQITEVLTFPPLPQISSSVTVTRIANSELLPMGFVVPEGAELLTNLVPSPTKPSQNNGVSSPSKVDNSQNTDVSNTTENMLPATTEDTLTTDTEVTLQTNTEITPPTTTEDTLPLNTDSPPTAEPTLQPTTEEIPPGTTEISTPQTEENPPPEENPSDLPPKEVEEPPPKRTSYNIADLPIVVEIPIIKVEKDAEIGDIVTVPKLVEIEKFQIKQEALSPVRSTAPNPFSETELIKENVMVQIPQENLVIPKLSPSKMQSPPKKRGRKKKVVMEPPVEPPLNKRRSSIPIPTVEPNLRKRRSPLPPVEPPPLPPSKRRSDTQKTTNNKKKKVEPSPPLPKKTRTKKGRSKSMAELSSSTKPKHLRVKSPLELNDILKAKHNDFQVPKSIEKQIISGFKRGITAAMEKNSNH